jgi:acyl dehydratase
MPLNYEQLMSLQFEEQVHTYAPKDCILYALGVGLGTDPLDERQLQFLFETHLRVLPTMSVTLALPKPWVQRPETGITWRKLLHGEQGLVIHRPLAPQGVLECTTRIDEIVDKGREKGAIVYMSREVRDRDTGAPVFTAYQTLFCRADGGFGGSKTEARPVPPIPDRAPDLHVDLPTLPQAALIYRLSGDLNPIHASPSVAREAGFDRPILHGLCSFGVAGHALLRGVGGYKVENFRTIRARFSSPVFPGETLRTEIWDDGHGQFSFRCRVLERDTLVLNNGTAALS